MIKKSSLNCDLGLSIDSNHFFNEKVKIVKSPNVGGILDSSFPLFIVLHYTATKTAKEAIEILTNKVREVSAHLVIDRDGSISQLVALNCIAWHAGVSSWEGIVGLNKCSIGIELVNAGKLELKENRLYSCNGDEIGTSDSVSISESNEVETYWHSYPVTQLNSLKQIIVLLKSKYNISNVIMHSEVAPDRKIDPGPAFPIADFRNSP